MYLKINHNYKFYSVYLPSNFWSDVCNPLIFKAFSGVRTTGKQCKCEYTLTFPAVCLLRAAPPSPLLNTECHSVAARSPNASEGNAKTL